jgi:hypothetical protein
LLSAEELAGTGDGYGEVIRSGGAD